MIIQLNTDKHIAGSSALTTEVERKLSDTLKWYASRLTRVEVHLSDLNSSGSGPDDKRCVLEARVAETGMQPVSASHQASTVALAVDGAAEKLARALSSALGKRDAIPPVQAGTLARDATDEA